MTSQIVELARNVVAAAERAAATGVTRPWLCEARTLADEVLRMHEGDARALYVILNPNGGYSSDDSSFVAIETPEGVSVSLEQNPCPNDVLLNRIGPLYLSPSAVEAELKALRENPPECCAYDCPGIKLSR